MIRMQPVGQDPRFGRIYQMTEVSQKDLGCLSHALIQRGERVYVVLPPAQAETFSKATILSQSDAALLKTIVNGAKTYSRAMFTQDHGAMKGFMVRLLRQFVKHTGVQKPEDILPWYLSHSVGEIEKLHDKLDGWAYRFGPLYWRGLEFRQGLFDAACQLAKSRRVFFNPSDKVH